LEDYEDNRVGSEESEQEGEGSDEDGGFFYQPTLLAKDKKPSAET
jgi:hypothetical protein